MRTPTTATIPTSSTLARMTDAQLIDATKETQSALRIAFARRRYVCDTGERLDTLVEEVYRRGLRL